MTVTLRPAQVEDIAIIVASARSADVIEMKRLGTTVEKCMVDGMRVSDWTAVGCWNGEPVCMFGVAPISVLGGLGAPWMVGTETLEKMEKGFLRGSRNVVKAMLMTYPGLMNVIDVENVRAIKWLHWLGFRFDEDVYMVGKYPVKIFRAGVINGV